MPLDLVETTVGIVSLVPLVLMVLASAQWLPLGALALPSVMAFTSIVYFYLMPVVGLIGGEKGVFGVYLSTLQWAHFAVFLYAIGAVAAFGLQRRYLLEDPAVRKRQERPMRMLVFWGLWAIAGLGVVFQVETDHLSLLGSPGFEPPTQADDVLAFLQETFNLMIPLTILLLIRDRFGWRSLLVLAAVAFIVLQVGFRFRIILLLGGAASAFALTRNLRMRLSYALVGGSLVVLLVNVIGSLRQYGQGLDLTRLDTIPSEQLTGFSGEMGIAYTLAWIADNPLPQPVPLDPWTVALARFVPSFLWLDKPAPDYLNYIMAGTNLDASRAGLAASQHVEMLLQWGWFGPPMLAFLYFLGIGFLLHRLNRLGYEARIAGCSLVPAYFGFYMQSRGYFFQIFADSLFVFGPLFLVHLAQRWAAVDVQPTSLQA
jgi:hypothetical protein